MAAPRVHQGQGHLCWTVARERDPAGGEGSQDRPLVPSAEGAQERGRGHAGAGRGRAAAAGGRAGEHAREHEVLGPQGRGGPAARGGRAGPI